MRADIEANLAKHIVRRAAIVGPIIVLGGWLFRGVDGAIAAALGVAIVIANFLASGIVMSAAARVSLTLYHAAALFGFLLRLVLITVVMLVVAQLFDIDRMAFGVAAVVSYLVLLTLEAVAIVRSGEKELEWTS